METSPPSLKEGDKKLKMLQLINELNTLVNEQTQTKSSNHGIKSFGTRDEFNSNTFLDYVKENVV